jgi:hypothetical protein
MLSIDYGQAASTRQWRSLPIFSGRNLVYSWAESGMILPLPSGFSLRRSAYLCVLCVNGPIQRRERRDTQRAAELLGHFGEAVAEGVDDEFETVRDLEL